MTNLFFKYILITFVGFFSLSNVAYAIDDTGKKTEEVVLQAKTLKTIKDGDKLTLQDCIDIAMQNSPSVKRYKNLVKSANALLGQSKASYFPSLSIGTGYYGDMTNISGYSDTDGYYGLNTSLNQLLFSFGKVGTIIKKAKLNKIAADFDLNNEELKTIYNVKTNYYGVLAALANIEVQKANISINERQYQQTKAYFEEGLKSKIDLVNAEVNLSNAKIDLVSAEHIYDSAVVALNNSMYLENSPKYSIEKVETFNFKERYAEVKLKHTTQDIEKFEAPKLASGAVYQTGIQKNELLNQTYSIKKFPLSLDESIVLAKENRPDLKSYIAARDALKQELKYQKIQYLPDLKAKVGYGLNANDNTINSFQVQGTLDFASMNFMDLKYKIDDAKAKLDVADNLVEKLSKDIYFSVQNAYVNMVQLEMRVPLTDVQVKQSFENLELALGRYEVGLGNFLEVQDAIINYNKSQENYVKLIFDYNVAIAKLEMEIAKLDVKENTKNE